MTSGVTVLSRRLASAQFKNYVMNVFDLPKNYLRAGLKTFLCCRVLVSTSLAHHWISRNPSLNLNFQRNGAVYSVSIHHQSRPHDPIALAVKLRRLCKNGVHQKNWKLVVWTIQWETFAMSEVCLNAVLLKVGVVPKQLASDQPARKPAVSTYRDCNQLWHGPFSAEAAALSTEPNLFQTQRQPKRDQNQKDCFF